METILHIDQKLFLWLNGDYAPWLDIPFWYISKTATWLPVYAVLLYLMYRRYPGYKFLFVVGALFLLITVCDRSSVLLFKDFFHRLRPSWEPSLNGMIHLFREKNGNLYKGGMYGFISSHAANYSGIITFFVLAMRPLHRGLLALLIFWGIAVSFSRIYLGVHYPGDVLAGWIFGALVARGIATWFRSFIQ